jgi:solute carrier family 25 (mitochondrial folate transporter), member 32
MQPLHQYYDKSTIPLIAGFTGGIVSTSLLLPLDIVKLRLQVSESTSRKHRFRSFRIVGGILKYEGVRGLYQGWVPAVIGSSLSWGGYFYFYEQFKRRLVQYKLGPSSTSSSTGTVQASDVLTSIDNFVVAVAASSVMVAITNPIWLVKTRMQLQLKRAGQQHNIRPYEGTIDAFRTIVKDEGLLALYKGVGPAFLLTSHGGVQFVVYEALRKQFHYSRKNQNNQPGDGEGHTNVWQRLQLSAGYLTMGAISKLCVSTSQSLFLLLC